MKKRCIIIVLLTSIVALASLCLFVFSETQMDLNGSVLILHRQENGARDIASYDLKTGEVLPLVNGAQATYLNESELIVKGGVYSISKYNLNTEEEEILYESDHYLGEVSVRNSEEITIRKYDEIILCNVKTKDSQVILSGCSSLGHSWSKDGNKIYYSDYEDNIICYNFSNGESELICKGWSPIISSNNKLAYKNNNMLMVLDLETKKQWKCYNQVYNYCFSPDGNYIMIETDMKLSTGIKNLFKNGPIMGTRIMVWDYENGQKCTLVEYCEQGAGSSFAWR